MARELFNLVRQRQTEKTLPGFRTLLWFYFYNAQLSLLTRFFRPYLKPLCDGDWEGLPRVASVALTFFLKHSNFVFYCLYMAGFITFVLSLKGGQYIYQFGQYAWTHIVILITLLPAYTLIALIFEGIIWFLLPALLVVVNDIFAYLFGIAFGRTPLISLSPKKTLEGFMGAAFTTIACSLLFSRALSKSKWFVCPRTQLAFLDVDNCTPGPSFQPMQFRLNMVADLLPQALAHILASPAHHLHPSWWSSIANFEFWAKPVHVHAVMLACAASLIAPFGGFFASGLKRAFKLKDFGDSIPGHGGITDRFDCQLVMSIFTYMYYVTYVQPPDSSYNAVLQDVDDLEAT